MATPPHALAGALMASGRTLTAAATVPGAHRNVAVPLPAIAGINLPDCRFLSSLVPGSKLDYCCSSGHTHTIRAASTSLLLSLRCELMLAAHDPTRQTATVSAAGAATPANIAWDSTTPTV